MAVYYYEVSCSEVKYYNSQTLPDEEMRRARAREQDQTPRCAYFALRWLNIACTNLRNAI